MSYFVKKEIITFGLIIEQAVAAAGSAPDITFTAENLFKFYTSVVKKITAILFLSVYLLSATGIGELFKINTLVQHFHETNNTGKPVGFLRFLVSIM
jgi:hypothetical protein